MAQPIVQTFIIDTTESEQNLKDLNVQINATSTAIDSSAQSFQNVAAAEESVGTSTKSLKAQLRDLQAQLANTEPDSAKYRELAAAAGDLKDKIGDAAEAVGTQAGGAFERVGGSLGLVTSRISNLDFEGAAEGAKLLAQNITEIKPGDIAKGIKGIGSAFASVGKALLTNPIFLIGAAIAAAIVYSKELLSLVDGVSSAEEEALNKQKERASLAKEQVDIIGQQEESLKRQGKSEEEILKLKVDALNAAILEQQIVVETSKTQAQAQIAAAERNYKYLKGFLDFVTLPQRKIAEFFFNFYNGAVDLLNKLGLGLEKVDVTQITAGFDAVNDTIAKALFDPEQTKKEGEKVIKESEATLRQLTNQRDGLLNQQDAKDKARRDKNKQDDKEANDKKLADEKKLNEEIAALKEQQYQESLSAEEKELRATSLKYQKLRAEAGDNAEQLKQLQILEAQELQDISNKYFDDRLAAEAKNEEERLRLKNEQEALRYDLTTSAQQKEIDAITAAGQAKLLVAQGDAELIKIINAQTEAEIQAVKDKYADEDKAKQEKKAADEKALLQGKLDFAKGILGNIASITESYSKGDEARAKKAFKVQKAISIAQATIDTYEGAQAAFVSTQKNPVSVLFPAAPYIAAGAAVAAGIANVAAITKQQFQGSTTPSTNETPPPALDGGGGGSQPAQFNPLAAQFLQNRPEQVTPRAFVLAGDVASQQEVRQKVEDLSRIG